MCADQEKTSEARRDLWPSDAHAWRARLRLPVIAAAVVILVWSACAFAFTWHWEASLARAQFESVSKTQFVAVQDGLDDYLAKLSALRGLFESNNEVTRAQFMAFTARLLHDEPSIHSFSWVPRIMRTERTTYEQAAVRDGIVGYGVKSVTPDDRLVPSPERDEYLPVFFSSVAQRQSAIYGIDLASQPAVLSRLEAARDNDRLSVVPDFALHSSAARAHAFLFSLPVYRAGLPHGTVEERRANLLGFVHGAFLTEDTFDEIIRSNTAPTGLDLYLFAGDAPPDSLPLHSQVSGAGERPAHPPTLATVTGGVHVANTISAGDAHWRFVAVPVAGGPMAARHDRAWLVLAASLLIGAGALFHFYTSDRQTRRLMAANARISELARTDPLTGLMNRRAFSERLNAAFAACRRGAAPFSLLYFDLDHFKDVNDTLGHPSGDRLLREVAERLVAATRASDCLARFGGDEFALLQADADDLAPEAVAHRIRDALAHPFAIDGSEVRVTCSVGIASYGPDVANSDALMVQADLALYRAKDEGRDCFRFHSEEFDLRTRERIAIAAELRGAVDRGEMRLFYQPQVDLPSGRIVGLEALARWQHPLRGLIGPSTFIPIAERTGSIVPLGQWVFEEACRQLHAWHRIGLDPGVLAVNFSAIQLKSHVDLDRLISGALVRWQIDPRKVEIELTESVLMEASQHYGDIFEAFHRLGLRTAIDDFGTGYSSLSYLTNYPVSRLKIAQDLMFGVNSDLRSATVVRAAIRLAKDLGIACIAEGVETKAQADFLVTAGCDTAQGYYFGAPIGVEEITRVLQQQAPRRRVAPPRLALVSG
ncbi:MAG TPA: EAL domain-containing protein [Xanthobacteraceae bacterium]|nr:EAL domain-containing protein [Xanthobacteraceae bacterium]